MLGPHPWWLVRDLANARNQEVEHWLYRSWIGRLATTTCGGEGDTRGAVVLSSTAARPTSSQRVRPADEGIIAFSHRGRHLLSSVVKALV